MPLTQKDISDLAKVLDQHSNPEKLKLLASDLGVTLDNIAPRGATMYESAFKLISELNYVRPPRDGELLEELRGAPNPFIQAIANRLATPLFFSPTGDPHDAIVLGKQVFVDRAELRRQLREFTNPNPYTTRVLIVRGEGEGPCGKSHSFPFLQHLAVNSVGALALRLGLAHKNYTPKRLFENIFALLLLDKTRLPCLLKDDPQEAWVDALINEFIGQVSLLRKPYWLVIDDLNHDSVTREIRETAYAIARAVEDSRPENLWVALLGYNSTITDSELQLCAQDVARFPGVDQLAGYLVTMAEAGRLPPLTPSTAQIWANRELTEFPELTKEAMIVLMRRITDLGEKLRRGELPSAV